MKKTTRTNTNIQTKYLIAVIIFAVISAFFIFSSKASNMFTNGSLSITTAQQVMALTNPPVNESSGMSMWGNLVVHLNDSGGMPALYAFNTDGQLVATVNIPNANNTDWEDLEIVKNSSGVYTAYIGDIGDNASARAYTKIYTAQLPNINTSTLNQTVSASNVVRYQFIYEDGPRDAESLAVHPQTGRIYVISKQSSSGRLYEAPTSLVTSGDNILKFKATVPVNFATGASISSDGKYLAVMPYANQIGKIYSLSTNDVGAEVLSPTIGPKDFTTPNLGQAEAVCFTNDSKHMLISTEGAMANPPIWGLVNSAYSPTQGTGTSGFSKISVGMNFQAGWSNGLHTQLDNEKIIDEAVKAGMKWVRIDIGWSTIEESGDIYGSASDPTATYPSSASNHWYVKKIDQAVNYAKSKGINVMGVWWTTPSWNTDGGAGKSPVTRPAGYPSYPEYAESAEWAAKYWAGRIDHWEVWNEADPDQSFWLKPDGSKHTLAESNYYAELLKSSYPAFKRGNPNAKVLVSGASSVDVNWYTNLYANGIKNYFDILAVHPYEGLANNDPLNTTGTQKWHYLYIPTLRQLMVANGDSNKSMWFTEMGYSTHANEDLTGDGKVESWHLGVTEQQQGDYLVKAIDHAKNNWPYVEVFIIYTDKNRSSASGDAETIRHQLNFGLLKTDNTPKPAMGILKTYIDNNLGSSTTSNPKADINNDSIVNVFDLSILLTEWSTATVRSDLNNDGIVNVFDLSILLSNWSI